MYKQTSKNVIFIGSVAKIIWNIRIKMDDFNHKTIFVLDHTQYFGISGDNTFQLEFVNSKGIESVVPVSKSLWTTSVETAAEYCRIVWDLFPTGKYIRFIVSDANAHIVNTWAPVTQNLTHVMNAMAMVGVPPPLPHSAEFTVIHGLRAAVEALAEPTEQQKEKKAKGGKVINRSRVICITSARDDSSMKSLEEIFYTVVQQQNLLPSQGVSDFLKIDQCHLVVINLHPSGLDSMVTNRPLRDLNGTVKAEVHSVKARDFGNKLTHLILPHYDLASTTVTGIPMKEEQNASSSANYDVEIFHSRKSHSIICGNEQELPTSIKENAEYETVTLKWCTPRGVGAAELQPCLAQYRITPVDVTSRPSSCLINFLLNGRSVLLEMPRETGGKITSHMLSAHGGEIFIHTLHTSRSCLEDLPSVLESSSGKVTDYRINDYASIIHNFKLIPLKQFSDRLPDRNLARLRAKFAKSTKYFPLTAGSTIIYNIRQFLEPMLTMIGKEEITDEEMLKCQQIIYNLIAFEARHEPLTLPVGQHRLKGSKKDDQYKLLWAELIHLLEIGSQSSNHKKLMTFIKNENVSDTNKDVKRLNTQMTNSPMSPPGSSSDLTATKKKAQHLLLSAGNRSLYDIQVAADRALSRKRLDFAGRLCTPHGKIAKLYPNLKINENTYQDQDAPQFSP